MARRQARPPFRLPKLEEPQNLYFAHYVDSAKLANIGRGCPPAPADLFSTPIS
jgi:hypothetical protein